MSMHVVRLVGALLLVPLLAGCSGTRLFTWPWQKKEIPTASPQNPVHRVICMWEPSEGRGPDGLPCRGFAGQVLFFTRTSSTPVKVEGDVRVYVFDDQGSFEEQTRPIHQFDFLHSEAGDSWNRHLAIGTLGPSYNVFIPYTRRGRHQARCALQIRYTPPGGMPIFSDMSSIVLPGPPEAGGRHEGTGPLTVPQPTRTVTEYVEGPFGRQEAKPAQPLAMQAQTVVPPSAPPLGSIVRTPRGVAITQPGAQAPGVYAPAAQQPAAPSSARSLPAADFGEYDTSAARVEARSAAEPAGPAMDAERLARIEELLAQFARSRAGTAALDDRRAAANVPRVSPAVDGDLQWASEAADGSGHPYDDDDEDDWPVTPVGFTQSPGPIESRSGSAARHAAEPAVQQGPAAEPAVSPEVRLESLAYGERPQLSPAMLERTARRLRPRPSWFDEQPWSAGEPQQQTVVAPAQPGAQRHPLAEGT